MIIGNYIIDLPLAVLIISLLLIIIVTKKRLKNDEFYTLVISVLLSFLLAEGVCRLLNIGDSRVVIWQEERTPGEIYAYKPNGKLLYTYPDNPRGYFNEKNEVSGTINAKGFRGADLPFEKANGITRIAFLGDSFTLGMGVKDNDTLPISFERAIQSKYPNTQVLNFGISGTSTKEQIKLLEEYVIKFKPDVVVIVVFLNDADRTGTINFISRPKVLAEVRKNSFFINALIGSIEKPMLYKEMVRHYLDGYLEGSPGWESVKTGLRKGKTISEQQNFQLVVAVYPVLFKLDDSYPFRHIHKTIEDYCASLKIPFVDLFDGFVGQQDSKLWVHKTDQHPNEVANRIAAGELSKFFDSNHLMKK
ncbi:MULTISPECIES: SGNH/GDSL hydrolase family protein [unclassified Microcoleus]|uniref:SGNH/GDSL hydrolase family protein n=1 Tax=unclassified Microcoleus TaxID=2642155 RepID=UPI001DFA821B|nr:MULTISPECIES: SGNH/GDSL hydrolase family protein [unclassified Microcoleus]TAF86732.1 MAG: SGNH/GDSL hydrolase family protein [Oscillatoriales cyanobacterium]MCC3412825.1 SGNH/GDSL hydrolase family protein [Microcoleus sp. PH2017_02_FOX_O_A]MCC3451407.1 SGNH/GDSL hydrolase family protein [Microcoleus sp. PH2017_09_SFU_O_A]MCC3632315.1 SGNH/GDSL hydrolase family protein [Microcoleus sp. PH2017_39_LGB_O_B]MCC3644558.1 SGNH/GDSL hydrolase family protein [Microcoleus sp. PH2017_33_LGB_O_A]